MGIGFWTGNLTFMGSIPTVLKSSKIQKQYLHTVNTWKANSAIVEAPSVTSELIND